jgi:hypothetical protein
MVGIAPASVTTLTDRTEIYSKCGWYFYMCNSTLYSGPPTNYRNNASGERGMIGIGVPVDVTVDRKACTISFAVNGVQRGVAYANVFTPTDALVPVVSMVHQGTTVKMERVG